MIIGDVDFPEELIQAQRSGDLVIFAGAGVSIPAPSNFPNFRQLADEAAEKVGEQRLSEEPDDRLLGRLSSNGFEVHKHVKGRLTDPSSLPNPLHTSLLRLFKDTNSFRLVTTNFDSHFSTALSKDPNVAAVESYFAPALPLGNQFTGLVYLHGSVERPAEELILTDADFGRAYLTDGWARRFLLRLFQRYTVLFVGYSHSDTVMTYLARGLSPTHGSARYSLVIDGTDLQRWRHLGIEPIAYPEGPDEDRHAELREGLSRWAFRSKMGALDHSYRIQEIVSQTPVLDAETEDYISQVTRELSSLRVFTNTAKDHFWLQWINKKHCLDPMFSKAPSLDPISQELSNWFAREYVTRHAEYALSIIDNKGGRVHPQLWHSIAWQLGDKEEVMEPTILFRWLNILIQNAGPGEDLGLLVNVMTKLRLPEDHMSAVMLFDFLTAPQLAGTARKHFTDTEQVTTRVALSSDFQWFDSQWMNLIRDSVSVLAVDLEPIVTNHLLSAYRMHCALSPKHPHWDLRSMFRTSIEPHPQDMHRSAMDVLIDTARVVGEWIVKYKRLLGMSLINRWSHSPAPLLQRLAIHGTAKLTDLDADYAIRWIVERGWLYAFPLKHEVFQLLKQIYPASSLAARTELLDAAMSDRQDSLNGAVNEETRAYEKYNLLYWLHTQTPDCSLTKQRFRQVQDLHPDFEPRDEPDLDRSITFSFVDPFVTDTTDRLLSVDLESDYGGVKDFSASEIAATVRESFEWSWKLAQKLVENDDWESHLWISLFRGWSQTLLNPDQTTRVINLLLKHVDSVCTIKESMEIIPNILYMATQHQKTQLHVIEFQALERLIDHLWTDNLNDMDFSSGDWFIAATNHPGGDLAQYLIVLLAATQRTTPPERTSVQDWLIRQLTRMLDHQSDFAAAGRVILANRVGFLLNVCRDWTIQRVLPLFDWDADEHAAVQAWHGFLHWTELSELLITRMHPYYTNSFKHLSTKFDNVQSTDSFRDRFCSHLSVIAAYGPNHPLETGWLKDFVRIAEANDRVRWARQLRKQLKSMSEEAIREIWRSWLAEYWMLRNQGAPWPLDSDEKWAMIEWTPYLMPVFGEAVEKVLATPAPPVPNETRLFRVLAQHECISNDPEASARLVKHALSNPDTKLNYWLFLDTQRILQQMAQLDSDRQPKDIAVAICERLIELEWPEAGEIAESFLSVSEG